MSKIINKSRRRFLEGISFGGALLWVSSLFRVGGEGVASAEVLETNIIAQPDEQACLLAAFSPVSGKIAVAGGETSELGEGQQRLYVSAAGKEVSFKRVWAPEGEQSEICSIAWSPNEVFVAFMAVDVDLGMPKYAELALYVANIETSEVRKVLKIGKQTSAGQKRLVNVDEEKGLAWYGDSKIIACSTDNANAILSIDIGSGEIETFIPAQEGIVWSPIIDEEGNLLFLRKVSTTTGGEVNFWVCKFDGDKVTRRKIPFSSNEAVPLRISPNNSRYVFLQTVEGNGNYGRIVVFDMEGMRSIKELPLMVKNETGSFAYAPVTVLNGRLVLKKATINPFSGVQLVSVRL